jgi:hypothetical protein
MISNLKPLAQQRKLLNEEATYKMGEDICQLFMEEGINIQNT